MNTEVAQTPERRNALKLVRAAKWQPVTFCRDILQLRRLDWEPQPGDPAYSIDTDWTLEQWQVDLIESVADVWRKAAGKPTVVNHEGKNWITVRAARGPGKTFGIAALAHVFGFAFKPAVICVTAPTLEHVVTRFMGEFEKIRMRAVPGYADLLNVMTKRVEWKSGDERNHFLIGETGEQPENVQGLRRRFTLYLVDEGSGVDDSMIRVIKGNLSATEIGILVMIGNPTRNTGAFADSHLKAASAKHYHRVHVGPQQSKRIKPEWLQRLREDVGETSPAYLIDGLGEFASDDEAQLIPREWILRAFERPRGHDGSRPQIRISMDVADGGVDRSVLTVGKHYQSRREICEQREYSFPSAESPILCADVMEQAWQRYGCEAGHDLLIVDSLGVGAGTAGELMRRKHGVVRYVGGAQSANPARWRNRRVQSYIALRDELRDGLLAINPEAVDQDKLTAQLVTIRSKPGVDRLEDLVSKETMKRDGVKSPDHADSLAMQFATQAPQWETGRGASVGGHVTVIESSLMADY